EQEVDMAASGHGGALAGNRLTTDEIEAALRSAIEEDGEIGLQVAAYLGEEPIVDTWMGVTDEATRQPVDASTIFPIFSVSKAITAAAIHLQAERGLIDYDAPVARYWPEYGTHGKD